MYPPMSTAVQKTKKKKEGEEGEQGTLFVKTWSDHSQTLKVGGFAAMTLFGAPALIPLLG